VAAPLDRIVAETEDGLRADVTLANWLAEPRARSQARLAAGQVEVDGQVIGKSRRLRSGERVMVAEPPPPVDAPAPEPVAVRYEDEHLLVVVKPTGLVVHAGAGVRSGTTLVDALLAMGMPLACAVGGQDPKAGHQRRAADRPGIVHRLDRGTSGLLVVAKTEPARAGLVAAFAAHQVTRRYWALVDGVPDPPNATVDAPILRSTSDRTRFVVDPGGRGAVSHYDVVEARGRAAVLALRLETGRTHQVRVHMAAVGHPVSGDLRYGASPALSAELGLTRPALHAGFLGFAHPVTGDHIECDEPLPPDLTTALARLRGRG
jgi:23S rRNA pseudouridine1911/1915/1917 synthase